VARVVARRQLSRGARRQLGVGARLKPHRSAPRLLAVSAAALGIESPTRKRRREALGVPAADDRRLPGGSMELTTVKIEKPENVSVILGQSHFIKTVEDIHEVMVSSVPGAVSYTHLTLPTN
jgi:hypothetical protein